MAKDPAFLFYTNDFISGTQFFTDEQVGIYIRLLCAMHQHGRLSEKQVNLICRTYDNDVMCKFQKDDSGLYYNPRLEEEVEKRKKYTESRRNNRLKKDMSNISLSYVPHMENENENENKDIISKDIIIYSDEFLKFNDWLKNNAPSVLKMKEPITEEQLQKLKLYDKKVIGDILIAMHNKKDLTKKYTSAYLTLINWVKRNNTENGKTRIDSNIEIAKQFIEQSRNNGL
jgi:uncharacterized protein YdaU (DUF1376 family)